MARIAILLLFCLWAVGTLATQTRLQWEGQVFLDKPDTMTLEGDDIMVNAPATYLLPPLPRSFLPSSIKIES
jgi:hypothetical protein